MDHFEEITGKGIQAQIFGLQIQIGSAAFVNKKEENNIQQTSVHIQITAVYCGKFIFNNQYRKGLEALFKNLSSDYQIKILSGDNEGERASLEQLLS